jgi:guanylate kinase
MKRVRKKSKKRSSKKAAGARRAPQRGRAVPRRGLMFVLSSPSGAGKTTLARRLLRSDPNVELSISVTTRPMRPGERDGVHYHFIDRDRFRAMRERGELLEWAEVFGHSYGTPRAPVERALAAGRDVLFDIDWQGTQQLREKSAGDLVSVFVLPPSAPELERRLQLRAQDSGEIIRNRMAKASGEMSHWPEYDYVVINSDLAQAFADVRSILAAERLKRERQSGLSAFVRGLQEKL